MSCDRVLSLLCYSMMSYGENFRSDIYRRVAFVDCKKSGVQYYIGKSDDELLIAFRGTDTIRDLLHDLMFLKRTVSDNYNSGIRVHSGFFRIYKRSEICDRIHEAATTPDIRRIYITGHSLGAALASLCALDLASITKAKITCVVFGSPRVGNSAFVRTFNSNISDALRVECGNDAITKLPPALLGYRHVSSSFHIGKPKIPFFYSMRDHKTAEYFKALICRKGCVVK